MMSISAPSYSALRIIVITNNCEQRIHKYKSDEYLMDYLQNFCMPENCMVCVFERQRPLFKLERVPGSTNQWSQVEIHKPRRLRSYRLHQH
ncbi:PilI type IV pilus biogenesis protein [Salmonella enterica subsp. enterica serovar Bareilly]